MTRMTRASKPSCTPAHSSWVVYLLECGLGRRTSLYCGITNDLDARFKAHVAGKGAKYTRANPPRRVVGSCSFENRSSASRAEWQLKRQPRSRKVSYLAELVEMSSLAGLDGLGGPSAGAV